MPLPAVPQNVRRLIVEAIDSVPELEAILLLRSRPEQAWTAASAGARLYVSPTVAAHVLAVLSERGFFATEGDTYRYAPARPELDGVVEELARAYSTQLVAVTRLIHAKPVASVREFADAFRLRKDP